MSNQTLNQPPLLGLKVVELGGLAPAPFAGLILADWGAEVVRIDRPSLVGTTLDGVPQDILARGKRSLALDAKVPSGLSLLRRLIGNADVLIDPFRPGVLEKLGLGPDVFLGEGGLNNRLIFARLVGFPTNGAHKDTAGHDLNYLALSGVLSILPGRPDKPSFPLNLLADFAGGGLMCALGILLALHERGRSGKGQVVENDMVSSTRYVSSFALIHSFLASNRSNNALPSVVAGKDAAPPTRMQNLLDDGAPFYSVYSCADGKWFSVACIEPQFYQVFLETFLQALGETSEPGWEPVVERQHVRKEWAQTRDFLERGFKKFDRDHWVKIFEGKDACAVPVLSPHEAAILSSSDASPPPRPNLSRTPAILPPPIPTTALISGYALRPGTHTDEILSEIGVSEVEKRKLIEEGAIARIPVPKMSGKL